MEKKTASIIGIILGIAIIIVGFCVQGINVDAGGHESYGTPTIGSYIKFGADFYTEMYAVTQDVGDAVNSANKNIHGAVNNAQRNICGAIEKACDAIGWLIVAIGLVAVAYFVCKMVSSEQDNYNGYTVAPSIATSTTSPSVQSNTYSAAQGGVGSVGADEWICTCGKIHKNYESSCACGVTKLEAKAAQNK